ncbi:MAG: PIG-L family deacetylase [Rhodospirillaceae bacterium]|nr:PIG-L family deacetylase [Rhodospirillaceae bacterium]
MNAQSQTILVVAAHADDEVLGCGATMAKHAINGDTVHILILADGVTARDDHYAPKTRHSEIAAREDAARNAALCLGACTPTFCNFPDNRCDTVPFLDIVKAVEARIATIQPDIIYCHHGNDLNIDHRIVHNAVLTACRPLKESTVRAIYAFETASSTEWEPTHAGQLFRPTRFVDISAHTTAKLTALQAYDIEMRPFPHPRSAQALEAQWMMRGAQSGMNAAEAYVVIRERVL